MSTAKIGKNKGHEVSLETRRKISNSEKGKIVSKETRKKISHSKGGNGDGTIKSKKEAQLEWRLRNREHIREYNLNYYNKTHGDNKLC